MSRPADVRASDIYLEEINHPAGGIIDALLEQSGLMEYQREFEGVEYETKFRIMATYPALDGYLSALEKGLDGKVRYVVDRVRRVSHLQSYFFTDTTQESSLFRWNGGPMLKIKKHDVLRGLAFPVFRSKEQFQIDPATIVRILSDDCLAYVGTMRKDRIKDFVLDSDDGRIYSIAVTICETGGHYQRQFEVEYSGYLGESLAARIGDEAEVLTRLINLSHHVYDRSRDLLVPDEERKFDFVMQHDTSRAEAVAMKRRIIEGVAQP